MANESSSPQPRRDYHHGPLELNDAVYVEKSHQKLEGVVAFLGNVAFADGDDWVGVHLTGASVGLGNNDGSIGGHRYFSCGRKDGVFAKKSRVTKRTITRLDELRLRRELARSKNGAAAPMESPRVSRKTTTTSPTRRRDELGGHRSSRSPQSSPTKHRSSRSPLAHSPPSTPTKHRSSHSPPARSPPSSSTKLRSAHSPRSSPTKAAVATTSPRRQQRQYEEKISSLETQLQGLTRQLNTKEQENTSLQQSLAKAEQDAYKTRGQVEAFTPRMEVTARVAVECLLAFTFSVASLPNAIPPSSSYLQGILVPTLAVSVPHLIFVLGAAYPLIFIAIIFGMGGATAILCAATVNDGLMVAMFALFALWCSGLQFGPGSSTTSGIKTPCIMIAGLVVLSSWQLVRDGISITIAAPPSQDGGDDGGYGSIVMLLFKTLCQQQGLPDDCYEGDIPKLENPIEITIPGDGNFAGQTATLDPNLNDGTLTIDIPGGLWIVQGFWTWSGLTNSLAIFQNTIIVICWALLWAAAGRLLPPPRTVRALYSRNLLPAAVSDSVLSLESSFGYGDKNERSDEAKKVRNKRLVEYATSLVGGGMATVTAFEPRLCAPFVCTRPNLEKLVLGIEPLDWPKLKNLVLSIEPLVHISLAAEMLQLGHIDDERDTHALRVALSVLEDCSSALAHNEDPSSTDGLNETESPSDKNTFFGQVLINQATEIRTATTKWLDAVHHPVFEDIKSTAMSYVPWIYPSLTFFKSLLVTLTIPFRPRTWDEDSALLALKCTTGVTILVVIEVYWPGYRDFAINSGLDGNVSNPYVTSDGPPAPNLWSGWNLIAFLFAQTATMEGSIKKGVLRLFGTALGAFGAWLAVIVCSWSYDEYPNVNSIGLVAWLTVTTAIAAYFTVEAGNNAFMGLSKDNGYEGMYFAMTQALCALEIETGAGSRDDIVVNRLLGNLTGVLLAIILVIIPPQVRGADPKEVRELLQLESHAMALCMRFLLENKEGTVEDIENLQSSYLDEAGSKRNKANLLLKDASRMHKFPLLKVDARLPDLMENLTVTGSFVNAFLGFASHTAQNDSGLLGEVQFQNQIESILERLEAEAGETDEERRESVLLDGSAQRELDVLVQAAHLILGRLQDHFCILNDIEEQKPSIEPNAEVTNEDQLSETPSPADTDGSLSETERKKPGKTKAISPKRKSGDASFSSYRSVSGLGNAPEDDEVTC